MSAPNGSVRPVTLLLNFTPHAGGVGTVYVSGTDWQAAVVLARARGTGLVLRAVCLATALTVDRVVIR